jgi:putative flavoprotein involved in K+ transport
MAATQAALERPEPAVEEFETIVIGGGQAGLSIGYFLKQLGQRFVILDANERIGGAWRTRTWDSLRLFTPARYNGLPGWGFPASGWSFPTARETADYLEAYAERFELPVRSGWKVDRLSGADGRYVVECGSRRLTATSVVVATGFYGTPNIPAFAAELDHRIVRMHSSEYRRPAQLRPGPILLVGAGNSGADIAMEVAPAYKTWLSGPDKGQIPVRIESRRWKLALPLMWFVATRVLTVRTPIGRKIRPHVLQDGSPRIRVKSDDLQAAGVELVPRTLGVRDGLPLLEDGRVLNVENVIWCTGFRHDFDWIDAPVLDEANEPVHEAGVAAAPGLYFLGLDFQYSFASENVGGVRYDAKRIARDIASR